MNQTILLTVIEFIASLIIEGVILSMVFNWIATKSQEKQEQNLKGEMINIEEQNKFEFEQLQSEIRAARIDIINQIKESAKDANQ